MDMIFVIGFAEGSGFIGYVLVFVMEYFEITKKSSAEKKKHKA